MSINDLFQIKIVVVGYGSQGCVYVLNLCEFGFDVVIGLCLGGLIEVKVQVDGFIVKVFVDVVKDVDLVVVLILDMVQKKFYEDVFVLNMKQGVVLLFVYGLNVYFNMIILCEDLDVVLVVLKGFGVLVCCEYEIGCGVLCIWVVYQDCSGKVVEYVFVYVVGLGGVCVNLIQIMFKEEIEIDLFGEQVVLCGGVLVLVQVGFEMLVEVGYQLEIVYYEVLYELKLIVDLFYEGGIICMLEFIFEIVQYGDYVSGLWVIDVGIKVCMKDVLIDIQNGIFIKNWVVEYEVGLLNYIWFKQVDLEYLIEKVGKELCVKMVWL